MNIPANIPANTPANIPAASAPRILSHASLARLVTAWIQPVLIIALFVLWRIERWSLGASAEACVVAAVLVYSLLNFYAAVASAWGGSKVLAARASRLVGVILFIVMRYRLHYGFWRSAAVWAALWIVAAAVSRNARRRAAVGAPVRLAATPSRSI